MVQSKHILVVEDERDLAEMLQYNLRRSGYRVSWAPDGPQALAAVRTQNPDLIVLDVMLPGLSGLDVARQVRTNPASAKTPILMLTARAEEADQLAGLAVGADDYVTKPFSPKVLIARLEALLRRSSEPVAATSAQLRVGPVAADLSSHRITVDDVEVKLTLTEFKLLVALLQSQQRVLNRNDLIARVMGAGIVVTARTIDVHIAAIRKKLGIHGGMIRTIRGVGYQLLSEVGESHISV